MTQLLTTYLVAGNNTNTYSSNHTCDFGIEKHGQLPPPFYPAEPDVSQNDFDVSNGQSYRPDIPDEFQPIINETIIFGGYAGSDDSSPTLPPSAASTFYPHPTQDINAISPSHHPSYQDHISAHHISYYPEHTPPVDVTPSPLHSTYEGYGHARIPEPSQTISSSPKSLNFQTYPVFDLPFRYGYSQTSSYSGQRPSWPLLGSHLPLRSSITPLNDVSQDWPLSNASPPSESPAELPTMTVSGQDTDINFLDNYETENGSQVNVEANAYPTSVASPATAHEHVAWCGSENKVLHKRQDSPSRDRISLPGHLLQYFNTLAYADCSLQITHQAKRFEPIGFVLHGLLIAQSPILRSLFVSSELRESGQRDLQIEITDRFVTSASIEDALRVCYGESPAMYETSTGPTSSLESPMDNALAYAAAGHVLQIPAITIAGIQAASRILTLGNIEKALAFVLDGGAGKEWISPTVLQHSNGSSADDISIQSSVIATPESSEDIVDASESRDTSSFLHPGTYAPHANPLLQRCLSFIKSQLSTTWELDTSARPLDDTDRLPVITESTSSTSKSRLGFIQFGDFPPENVSMASNENIIVSSILLSLPYSVLKDVLDLVEEPISQRITKAIIEERERRRKKVLESKAVGFSERYEASHVWLEVGWEESVVESDSEHGSGCRMTRKWTGYQHLG